MNLYDLGQLDLSDLPPILHRITSNGNPTEPIVSTESRWPLNKGLALAQTLARNPLNVQTSQDDLDEKVTFFVSRPTFRGHYRTPTQTMHFCGRKFPQMTIYLHQV